jgi:hypothetical protein
MCPSRVLLAGSEEGRVAAKGSREREVRAAAHNGGQRGREKKGGGRGGPEENEARDVIAGVREAGVDPEVDGGGHAVDDAHKTEDPDEEEAVDYV